MSLCGLVFVSTVTDLHRQQQSELGPDRRPLCVLGYRLGSSFSFRCSIRTLFFDIGVFFGGFIGKIPGFFLNRYNDSYSQCNQASALDDHGDEIRSRSIQM